MGARGALRPGPRLSRRGVWRAEPGIRRHGSRARARPRGAGGPRLDRQEHDVAAAGPRVVVLHRGAADHRRARARCAAAGSLRLVPRLSRRLPHRGFRGALRARRPPVHLVSHHRAPRRDRGRARVANGRVAVRLRPLPDRLPVEPQGARDGRGGVRAVGTLSGGGRGARDDGRRAAPSLRRHAALAPQAGRSPPQCGHRACQCPRPRSPWRGAGGGCRGSEEMNERTDEGEGTGAPSIDAQLDRITLIPYGMPVRLMEAVIERGSDVTAALAEALERWRGDEEQDALWLVVLLGEVGGPDAVAPLIRQLHRTDLEILAEAAVEGLAKIGAPSAPALRELARTGEPAQRLYAYAGLGWIEDDTAYTALVEGLGRDLDLADGLATALARHAPPE